jgi:tRNA-splicing ligase RtcB
LGKAVLPVLQEQNLQNDLKNPAKLRELYSLRYTLSLLCGMLFCRWLVNAVIMAIWRDIWLLCLQSVKSGLSFEHSIEKKQVVNMEEESMQKTGNKPVRKTKDELLDDLAKLNKPCKLYIDIDTLEASALQQFVTCMSHDAILQGALMPDAHHGYTLNIGGVVASESMIFPSFVGYDIGCGLIAVPTTYRRDQIDTPNMKKEIFDQIYRTVPVGFNQRKDAQQWDTSGYNRTSFANYLLGKKALSQLGTLGGGNHFIEIGYDEQDRIWIVIHSGSRGFGYQIAEHYIKKAHPEGKPWEGVYGFHVDSDHGRDYISDMNFALAFALENRVRMIEYMEKSFGRFLNGKVLWDEMINRNHNHAELDSKGRWIHRKGATHAELGMLGVVPGNMRDGSFIVKGKGNLESMSSSSHGAGRIKSRTQAMKDVNLGEFKATMQAAGVMAKINPRTIDESPFVYKNIFDVMEAQKDLVEVIAWVRPLVNVKADEESGWGKRKKKNKSQSMDS